MTTPSKTVTGKHASVTFSDTSDWGAGFIGSISIADLDPTAINGWTLEFDLASQITNLWNGVIVSHVGTHYVIKNQSYDATIAASGGTVSFGFQAMGGNPVIPTSYTLNGQPVVPAGPPTLSVGNVSVDEGAAGAHSAVFTVSLSSPASSAVSVHYATADRTAHAGQDYTAANGTISFAAGQVTASVSIATQPDTPGSRTFVLDLSSPAGATIAQAEATATLVSPTPPGISAQNVSVSMKPGPAGSSLLPAGFVHTKGNQIVDASGNAVKIAAVNWSGLETGNFAPDGLWARNYQDMMRQMVSLGFNTIRLPFSLQLFASNSTPSGINYTLNPDLQGLNGQQIMDKIVSYAGQIGLKIILDDHRSAAGPGPNGDGLWYDGGYTEKNWIDTWTALARHYAGNTTIIGADLSNEPHNSATWGDGSATDWAAAATRAGDAIQAVSSNWLMFVEGIQTYQGSNDWWGGNLQGVAAHPVTLTVANRVVYSPHDYPSSVSSQPWFSASNYPNNLPSVWNQNWGYIFQNNIAPVFVGEFGTKLATTSDQQWLSKLVAYLGGDMNGTGHSVLTPGEQGISWSYWEWNPNSGDTGGILQDDWTSVNQNKVAAITPIEYKAGTGKVPTEADFTVSLSRAASSSVSVHYATANGTAKAGVDYTATSGTLTFAPGEVTKIVPAMLLDPTGVTGSRSFLLDLSAANGGTLATTSATATLDYGTTAALQNAITQTAVLPVTALGGAVTTEQHVGGGAAMFGFHDNAASSVSAMDHIMATDN